MTNKNPLGRFNPGELLESRRPHADGHRPTGRFLGRAGRGWIRIEGLTGDWAGQTIQSHGRNVRRVAQS